MIRFFGILSICILLLLAACSPERKLARQYIKHYKGNGIMIVPSYELYKDNLTISYDTLIKYTQDQFDSIAWVQSCYVQHVSDSVFLTTFTNSLISELSAEGYDVYVDESSDVFLSLPDPKWMVQIAQLQLNEQHRIDSQPMYAEESDDPYYINTRINQIALRSWFEVSRTNSGNRQVLFLEGYIQDDFMLGFDVDLMEGTIGILNNRDSVKLDDVYKMADESGRKHAGLLLDYFMNDYIRENMPSGIKNREYFHYNRKANSLKLGLEERFEVVN